MRDDDGTYLVGEEVGTLKIVVEAKRNKFVEFGDNTITLGLIAAITCGVPGANLAEVFRVGLAEVVWANPYLIEDTERTAKLVKVFAVLLEWIRSGCGHCRRARTRDSTRVEST